MMDGSTGRENEMLPVGRGMPDGSGREILMPTVGTVGMAGKLRLGMPAEKDKPTEGAEGTGIPDGRLQLIF
jgi:hypothetical protein